MTLFLASPSVAVRRFRTGWDTARVFAEFAVPTAVAVGGGTSTACGECAPLQR
jgi:hypothetical protein